VIFGHGWELSSLHFGRLAGAILPQYSSLRASALSCHTSARAGGGSGPASCQVGLDRPLIPAAFVANLFRSARASRPRRSADRGLVRRGSPDPAVWPTVGLQVTHRRSGTGSPSAAEDGLVRRPLPDPAFEVPGSSRAWPGGPTDARENLKKLRCQLGLRNN